MPLDVAAEPERVRLLVSRDVPRFGERGLRLQLLVVAQERLVDVPCDGLRRPVVDEADHEARRLGRHDRVKNSAFARRRPLRGDGRGGQRASRGGDQVSEGTRHQLISSLQWVGPFAPARKNAAIRPRTHAGPRPDGSPQAARAAPACPIPHPRPGRCARATRPGRAVPAARNRAAGWGSESRRSIRRAFPCAGRGPGWARPRGACACTDAAGFRRPRPGADLDDLAEIHDGDAVAHRSTTPCRAR
jgi:hypothetical protein